MACIMSDSLVLLQPYYDIFVSLYPLTTWHDVEKVLSVQNP